MRRLKHLLWLAGLLIGMRASAATATVISMSPTPTAGVTTCSTSVYSPVGGPTIYVLTDTGGLKCVSGTWQVAFTFGGGGGGASAFADLSGTATDAQIPNNITVDLATAATALSANTLDRLLIGGGGSSAAKQGSNIGTDSTNKVLIVKGDSDALACANSSSLFCTKFIGDLVTSGVPSGMTISASGKLTLEGGMSGHQLLMQSGELDLLSAAGSDMYIASGGNIYMSVAPGGNVGISDLYAIGAIDSGSYYSRLRYGASDPTNCTLIQELFLNTTTGTLKRNTSATTTCSWSSITSATVAAGAQYALQSAGAAGDLADSGIHVDSGGTTLTGLRQYEAPDNSASAGMFGNGAFFPGNTGLTTDMTCSKVAARFGITEDDDTSAQNVVLCENGALAWDPPAATDDTVIMGNGSRWDAKAIPNCNGASTEKLLYTASTNTWSCGTDAGGGASGDNVTVNSSAASDANLIDGTYISWSLNTTPSPDEITATIVNDSLTSSQLAANSVGASEIAADAVGTSEIATDGVGAAEISADAVGSSEIAADAVGTSEIATDGVGAAEIAAGAVGDSEIGSLTSAEWATHVSDETGSGLAVFGTSPTLTTPNLGTPSAATLTNATGLPVATGISGLGTGVATALATPSSANLRSAVTDETGTGSLVFSNAPTFDGSPTLTSPAVLQGDRFSIVAGRAAALASADGAMAMNAVTMSSTEGPPAIRAGSVLGISFLTTVSAFSGTCVFDIEIRKGSTVLLKVTPTVSGNGVVSATATQARGTVAFAAGDILNFNLNYQSGTCTFTNSFAMADLIYDS